MHLRRQFATHFTMRAADMGGVIRAIKYEERTYFMTIERRPRAQEN